MAGKKGKSVSKGKASNKPGSRLKSAQQANTQGNLPDDSQLQLTLDQKLILVKTFWDTLHEPQRMDLLTVDVVELRQWAAEMTEKAHKEVALTLQKATVLSRGISLVHLLESGILRLYGKPSGHGWKVWQWPKDSHEFLDQASFRLHVEQKYMCGEMAHTMPQTEAVHAKAAALKTRMMNVLEDMPASKKEQLQKEDTSVTEAVDVITDILTAFEKEHHYLYDLVMVPVINLVCQILSKAKRITTETDLHYLDLEKIPGDLLCIVCQWLSEAVDLFSKNTGDLIHGGSDDRTMKGSAQCGMDKYSLNPQDRTQLQVDPTWFQHLQAQMENMTELNKTGEANPGLAVHHSDFMLEWIFQVASPSADSFRAWAQCSLGAWTPTVEYAHKQLMAALKDMQAWQLRVDDGKKLLHDMLVSRRSIAELGTKYDLRPRPNREENMHPCELPDHVVVAILKREALLNRVRLHTVQIQDIVGKERLRSAQTKQCQGEPKFERWKRELEAPYKTPQTKATAKQLPKTRAGVVIEHGDLADRFESLGEVLRGYETEEKQVAAETEFHDEEIKHFSGWAENILSMATTLEEVGQAQMPPLAEGLQEGSTCPCCNTTTCTSVEWGRTMALKVRRAQADQLQQTAVMLKQAFQTDVRYQLHDDKEDHRLYQLLQIQLRQIEDRQQEGRAVLPFLEAYLLNLACDDPGTIIGAQLVLPFLQKRLLATAQEYHQQKAVKDEEKGAKEQELAALLASQQLLAEEEQEQAQAAAKKAKKQKAKAKKQQPQVEQPQPPPEAPSEPDSDSDQLSSEAYITTTAAAAFAGSVAPLDTDNVFSASTDFDLSTTLAPAAAPRWVGTQRLSKHGSNAETNEAVSPDSVLTASGKPKSEQLPHSERSVTAESSSSSSAAGSVRSDKTDQKVMDLFLCPITQVLMVDPIIAADGHTYERAAMQSWLKRHCTSPVTGAALAHANLVPNVVIRGVILQRLI